jgi:hypothetical protein
MGAGGRLPPPVRAALHEADTHAPPTDARPHPQSDDGGDTASAPTPALHPNERRQPQPRHGMHALHWHWGALCRPIDLSEMCTDDSRTLVMPPAGEGGGTLKSTPPCCTSSCSCSSSSSFASATEVVASPGAARRVRRLNVWSKRTPGVTAVNMSARSQFARTRAGAV